MPTYDYRCLDCRKRFDIYMTYSEYGTRAVTCSHCGSANVERKINKVRVAHSSESRLAEMGDPSNLNAIERDPRTLGRMMREMSGEIGEDMGAEFHEVVSRLEKGESPEAIERAMPDLGGDAAGGGLD